MTNSGKAARRRLPQSTLHLVSGATAYAPLPVEPDTHRAESTPDPPPSEPEPTSPAAPDEPAYPALPTEPDTRDGEGDGQK